MRQDEQDECSKGNSHLHPLPVSLTLSWKASGRRFRMALTASVLLPLGPELASVFAQLMQEQSSLQTAPDWKQSQYSFKHLLLEHLQVMASCSSAVKGRDVPATPVAVRADPTRPTLAFVGLVPTELALALLVGRGRAFFLGRGAAAALLLPSLLLFPPRFLPPSSTSPLFSAAAATATEASAAGSNVIGEDEDTCPAIQKEGRRIIE